MNPNRLWLAGLLAACSGAEAPRAVNGGGKGAPCESDADCASGLACFAGTCGKSDGPDGGGEGGPPEIAFDTDELDFGNPLVGMPVTLPLEVFALGGSPLHVTRITIEEGDSLAEYMSDPPEGPIDWTMEPASSRTIDVTLASADLEEDLGTLCVDSNDPAEPVACVNLVSELKGDPELCACVLDEPEDDPLDACVAPFETIAFGAVPVGESADAAVALHNCGDFNQPLVIESLSDISIEGSGSGAFAVSVYADEALETPAEAPIYLSPAGEDRAGNPVDANLVYVVVTFAPESPGDVGSAELCVEFETGQDPPPEPECIDIVAEGAGCPEGFVDLDGSPANGCECGPVAAEACNGADDDCDGTPDDGSNGCGGACPLAEAPGDACDGPDADLCDDDSYECDGLNATACSAGADNGDACDGADNDCDGTADNDGTNACGGSCPLLPAPGDPCDGSDTDLCEDDAYVCSGINSTACPAGSPNPETCDGVDNDCNGGTDEGGEALCPPAELAYCGASAGCVACGVGATDCNDTASDGCECGPYANGFASCAGGTCAMACAADWVDCEGTVVSAPPSPDGDGCETPAAPSCGGGAGNCDGNPCNGCETVGADNSACGPGCAVCANFTEYCAAGVCTACAGAARDCNDSAADGCETDTATDVANCGGCGFACTDPPNGAVVCSAGDCLVTCDAGYDPCGASCCIEEGWVPTATAFAPSARTDHTAIWTGSEMIVWGGGAPFFGSSFNSGGRYDPVLDAWTETPTAGAPAARANHTAVWTGSEMIVWGGDEGTGRSLYLASGGIYNRVSNLWTATPTAGAPSARARHAAVWTGSEMIVWGGYGTFGLTSTGGRYNLSSWVSTSTDGAPPARTDFTAVWTGSEMIVWGGSAGAGALASGARYDPATDVWTATPTLGAPTGRYNHTAVWTGSEMIVWGGTTGGTDLATGGRYNPADGPTGSWAAASVASAPSARSSHTAVWTGSRMIVWGGLTSGVGMWATGGLYDPVADGWVATTTVGAPSERYDHTAVWTDSVMIVWGGVGAGGTGLATGGRYTPPP